MIFSLLLSDNISMISVAFWDSESWVHWYTVSYGFRFMDMNVVWTKCNSSFCKFKCSNFLFLFFPNILSLQSRDPAVQAAILAQLNAKYGSGVLPDAPKDMSKVNFRFGLCYVPHTVTLLLCETCE